MELPEGFENDRVKAMRELLRRDNIEEDSTLSANHGQTLNPKASSQSLSLTPEPSAGKYEKYGTGI